MVCLIAINVVGSSAYAQQSVLAGPTPTENSGERSTARIISGMIQFEPSQPIRQPANSASNAPVQTRQQLPSPSLPLSKNTHRPGAGHSNSYGHPNTPYVTPNPNQHPGSGQFNSRVRPASHQQAINNPNFQNPNFHNQTRPVDPFQRYAPHFNQGFHGVRTSQGFGPAPRTAPGSVPHYLIPPGANQSNGNRTRNSILNTSSARTRGNGYNNPGFSLRQDEDPFGDNQLPQPPPSNNNSSQNPFGTRPQEGRVNPFADPPTDINQGLPGNPPSNLPPEVPRNDPFQDRPLEQDPRQTIDPPLPGRTPELTPDLRNIPVPDPYPNDENTPPDDETDPRRTPPRRGGAENPFTRSSRPIRRAPTKHYEPSGRGQLRDQVGTPYTEYAGAAGTPDFDSYHQQYSYPPSAPLNYAAPEYGGIVDDVGFNAFLDSQLNQSYSCCEPLFYVSIFGGYTSAELIGDAVERDAPVPTIGNYDVDDGFGVGFAIGQTQGANLRTELEYSFRSNDGDSFQLSNLPDLDLSGDVDSSSGMLNFVWDFNNISFLPRVRPYVGAGIGFSFVDADLETASGDLHTEGIDDDSAFAWQIITGVTYQLSTSTNLFLEYRYFETDSITLESNPNATDTLFGQFDYQVNNVFAGFRLRF